MVVLSATAPPVPGEDSENWLRCKRVQIVLSISGIVELLKYLEYILEALELDENSYQLKSAHRDDMFRMIRSIYDDQPALDSELFEIMRESSAINCHDGRRYLPSFQFAAAEHTGVRMTTLKKDSEHKPQLAFRGGLSEREVEVLEQVTHGASNKQIAATLGISESTVKTHITRIFQKLDANDRTNAVTKALRLGIIDL